MTLKRLLKIAGVLLAVLVLAGVAGGIWLRLEIAASLPLLSGEISIAGLERRVRVETDALGIPTLRGASRADVAFATGFVHAQNRYFQMDLMRRQAAGELAELLGQALLGADRANRVHRFRSLAQRVAASASAHERAVVASYVAGVNAGLAALDAAPFEYLMLRAEPAPWRVEDTVLVILAMFLELNDEDGGHESSLGVLHDTLPAPLFEFLAPQGTGWDAPVAGAPMPEPPIPGPEIFDLRSEPRLASGASADPLAHDPVLAGSNNWAVAGSLTATGASIVANDMHLGLSVPNIWYRASFVYPDAAGGPGQASPGGERRVTGITLPGTPAMVVGSNGRVAWGFTNSYGDWTDLVIVEPDPSDPNAYVTPDGPRPFATHRETLKVKGGPDETVEVRWTRWGPVIDQDHTGRPRALRWIAHDERAVNLGLLRMEEAGDLDEAVVLASGIGAPPQNIVIADSAGRIGWTIMGAIPRRVGFTGRLPVSWADGARGWDGWLSPEEYPRIVDPPGGRLWTANARVADGPMLAVLGDGGYDLGARAGQIRDRLARLDRAVEADMLAIQLDDEAIFLQRWRALLLDAFDALDAAQPAADPRRAEARRYVEDWGGRASIDSVGYRIVRAFRSFAADQVLTALTARCRQADKRFNRFEARQYESALWRLLEEKPAHLLDPKHPDWDAQIEAVVGATLDYFFKDGQPLSDQTWGRRNLTRILHPISRGVPALGRWLDMPARPLPGDSYMPRVQAPSAGASQRMAVSPGRESSGYMHMPCGQSGHPLSPHYRDAHTDWAEGRPTPFLPGPPVHSLLLRPK